jgi:hypothetical protein
MSHGRIIEQGSHDELYANDGMYRGLVDAQRISAESTGDGGDVTPEEVHAMEETLRRTQSIPTKDLPELLRRTTTDRSGSIAPTQVTESGHGVVAKKKYSLWYLLKKVL